MTDQMLADIARGGDTNSNLKLSVMLRATILLKASRGELNDDMLKVLGLMSLPSESESKSESKPVTTKDPLEVLLGGNKNDATSNPNSNS